MGIETPKPRKTRIAFWMKTSSRDFLEHLAAGKDLTFSEVANEAIDFYVAQYTGQETPETVALKVKGQELELVNHETRLLKLETRVEVLERR